MLDIRPLYVGLSSIIEQTVGNNLKQIKRDAAGTLGPAIFQTRQKQYKDNYPYITINLLNTRESGGWVENISVNDNDETEYDFNYQALFLISCFGDDAGEVSTILNTFKQSLSFEGVRQALYENSGNIATLQRSRDVVSSPSFLETDYEEAVSMEVVINFRNIQTDTSSTIIESVEIDGNYKPTEDSPPKSTTIIVP